MNVFLAFSNRILLKAFSTPAHSLADAPQYIYLDIKTIMQATEEKVYQVQSHFSGNSNESH